MNHIFWKASLLLLTFWLGWAGDQRVVSLAPNLTEIVCELGGYDQLVGVTDFCVHPESVKRKPKVGGYINPNLEIIVSLKPDIVLALPEHQDTASKLQRLGVRVETIRNWSLADIHNSIKTVGDLIGRAERAAAKLDELARLRDNLTRRRSDGPRCLLVLGHMVGDETIKEIYAVGNNGFLNEIIGLAGGVNVIEQKTPHYPRISQEALLQLDPDVIVDLAPVAELTPREAAAKQKVWFSVSHLTAVKKKKYFIIHADHVLQAGPRYLETLAELVKILDRP